MSDTVVSLVPVDPQLVPSKDARELAFAVARKLFEDAEVSDEVHAGVMFIHPHENLSAVRCPACDAQLSLFEEKLSEWWRRVEERCEEHGGSAAANA